MQDGSISGPESLPGECHRKPTSCPSPLLSTQLAGYRTEHSNAPQRLALKEKVFSNKTPLVVSSSPSAELRTVLQVGE